MKNYNSTIKFSLISKYRTMLMGVGVVNVLILHTIGWLGVTGQFAKLLEFVNKMVFTHGFIILSGYGILYSLKKNASYGSFIRKRIDRVWLPFIIMDIPFALFYFFCGDFTFLEMLLDVSSFNYFVDAKGMWYISTTMILYVISPLLYKLIFLPPPAYTKNIHKIILFRFVCVLVGISFILISMSLMMHDYFFKTYTAWEMFPIYLIGMFIGWMALEEERISLIEILLLGFVLFSSYLFKSYSILLEWIFTVDYRVLSILFICWITNVYNKEMKFLIYILEYLGKYSLEIYVLHLLIYFFLHRILGLLFENCYFFYVNEYVIVTFVLLISIIIAPGIQKLNSIIIERLKHI